MNIDWSKAPEGYPIWIESHFKSDPSDWHKRIDGGYQDRKKGIWHDWQVEANECTVHEMKQEWIGEGLPPVGTVCEWQESTQHEWRRITVIAYNGMDTWLHPVGIVGNPAGFRPIPTPEQIAAEAKRKEWIAGIESAYGKEAADKCMIILAEFDNRKRVNP